MTNLYFYYSPIYNKTLHELTNRVVSEEEIAYGIDYIERFITHWYQYNEQVFTLFKKLFGMELPEVWNIYLISYLGREYNFSMPTTVTLSEDMDHMVTKIIHEISHLMLFMNENSKDCKVTKDTWDIVKSKYPKEGILLQEHILVQFITFTIVKELYGAKTAKIILARELDYKIGDIDKAWKILFNAEIETNTLSINEFLQKI